MDREEAGRILQEQLEVYRAMTYEALEARVGDLDAFEVTTPEGKRYQLEIEVIWDAKPGGNIRVLAAIDDGGWSAFAPLSDDLVVEPGSRLS